MKMLIWYDYLKNIESTQKLKSIKKASITILNVDTKKDVEVLKYSDITHL